MKRNLILVTALALNLNVVAQQQDSVLMRINNKDITRSEFEYIYNKNNSNNDLDKKTLDEYVDLFVNFKLKVAAAEEAGMDTTKAFRNEFNGYRQQLAKPYLTDSSVDEANALAVYNRMKENVEAWHILLKLDADASKEEEENVYKKAEDILKRINKGDSFEKVARETSEDPSVAQNGGYLGYFTALQMVPTFEDAAFNLKVGEVSAPVRTDFGYHIIKVTNRRPDLGKVLVAHIFKALPQDVAAEKTQQAEAQIDSIYTALQGGSDFAEMAKKFSDDKGSATRGGELPWIGFRQTVKEFEDVAFFLNKGEMSKPFHSPVGIHIIKMIDRKDMEPFAEKKDEITRRLARMGQGDKGVKALVANLKKEYNSLIDKSAYAELETLVKTIVPTDSLFAEKSAPFTKTLLTVNGKKYSQQDFIAFLKTQRTGDWKNNPTESLAALVATYENKTILDYEDSCLDKKYPEFGNLMREYRDGILLFEISNNLVWDKASKDEKGLDEYFKANKANYSWDAPRYKGIVLHCKDKKVAGEVKKLMKKTPEDQWVSTIRKTFNNDSITVVKVEKGLYLKGDNKYVDGLVYKIGSFEPEKELPYTTTEGKLLKKGPESFRDVRGPVTADYQNYLETAWIKELRGKYKVEIKQEVLKTVNKH